MDPAAAHHRSQSRIDHPALGARSTRQLGQLGFDALLFDTVRFLFGCQLGFTIALFGFVHEDSGRLGRLGLGLLQLTFLGKVVVADQASDDGLGPTGDLLEITAPGVLGFSCSDIVLLPPYVH
jgi:hypothetical protein